jgi:DNA-directed RNA polymerase specialized sigma24 family protein
VILIYIFNSQFIDEYSKKILAFAYGKTGNIYDAEDLSHEILIALFSSIPKYPKIESLDGLVYTICHHCWSNYKLIPKKLYPDLTIINFILLY